MARSFLQLAALATAAIPEAEIVAASPFGTGRHGDFESALLTAKDGAEFLIRIPTSQRAESEQSADLAAIRSLSQGIRTRLPFAVSTYAGQTPVASTRAIVYSFVQGKKTSHAEIARDPRLAESIALAIAAIHGIPAGFVADAGLPVSDSVTIRRKVLDLIDSAALTNLLPKPLEERWRSNIESQGLWQFTPTVVNGALDSESFLVEGHSLVGILGWQDLSVGDPARDLHWIYPLLPDAVAVQILNAYGLASGDERSSANSNETGLSPRMSQIALRAKLYSELELAKWLLHGINSRSTEVVDDAVAMLGNLAQKIQTGDQDSLHPETAPILTVTEVQELLDRRNS